MGPNSIRSNSDPTWNIPFLLLYYSHHPKIQPFPIYYSIKIIICGVNCASYINRCTAMNKEKFKFKKLPSVIFGPHIACQISSLHPWPSTILPGCCKVFRLSLQIVGCGVGCESYYPVVGTTSLLLVRQVLRLQVSSSERKVQGVFVISWDVSVIPSNYNYNGVT